MLVATLNRVCLVAMLVLAALVDVAMAGGLFHDLERAIRPQDLPVPRFRVRETLSTFNDPIAPNAARIDYYWLRFENNTQVPVVLHMQAYKDGRWDEWTAHHFPAGGKNQLYTSSRGQHLLASKYRAWVETENHQHYWGNPNPNFEYSAGTAYAPDNRQIKLRLIRIGS
jgi:hypothetical protein